MVNPALIQHQIDAFLERQGKSLQEGSPEHGRLVRELIRAEIEALERTLERDEGNYGGSPAGQLIKRVTERGDSPGEGQEITEVFERFAAENSNRVGIASTRCAGI